MPLPSDEESKGGSYTEIDEIHGNQLQFREEEDKTKAAIELVENTAKSCEEDVDKKNDIEGPEDRGLLGESGAHSCGEDVVQEEVRKRNDKEGPGGFLGDQLQSREEEDETKTAIELVENTAKSCEEEVDKRLSLIHI